MKVEVTPEGGIVLPFSLSDSDVQAVCKPGTEDGCKYLMTSPKGWECHYNSPFLRDRPMRAQRLGCEQVKVAVTSIMEKAMREGNSVAYGSTYKFILTEE